VEDSLLLKVPVRLKDTVGLLIHLGADSTIDHDHERMLVPFKRRIAASLHGPDGHSVHGFLGGNGAPSLVYAPQ
jgi:hypothetical protein